MKRHAMTIATFAVASMVAAGPAAWAAQDPMPPAPPQESPEQQPAPTATATGELQQIDNDTMTLTVKAADDSIWTFRYTPATVIVGSQEGIAGLATTEGVLVTVHFDEQDGDRVATRIDVDERR